MALKRKLQIISRLAEEASQLSIDELAERIGWQLEILVKRIERKEQEDLYHTLKAEMERGQRVIESNSQEDVELKVKASNK